MTLHESLHDISTTAGPRGLQKSSQTNMAVREKGAVIDVLEKRISELERRVLTNEEDVQDLKGSSVIVLLDLFLVNVVMVPNSNSDVDYTRYIDRTGPTRTI